MLASVIGQDMEVLKIEALISLSYTWTVSLYWSVYRGESVAVDVYHCGTDFI